MEIGYTLDLEVGDSDERSFERYATYSFAAPLPLSS